MAGMDLVWRDQPDYYDTATLNTPRLWTTVHYDAIVEAGEGYNGQNALSGAAEDAFVTKALPVAGSDTPRLGYRLRVDTLPSADLVILGAIDGDGVIQVCVVLRDDGKLAIWRGPMDTELAVSDDAIDLSTELRLGFRAMVAKAGGSAEVFLDGESIVGVSDENTAHTDLYGWNGIYVGLAPDIFVSHLYAGTGTGDLPHDHMVTVRFPVATGTYVEWAANTGTVPAAIDDAASDEDTTYIASGGVGSRFTVTLDTLDAHSAIYGTSAVALVKNAVDSGSPSFAHVLVADGSTVYGPWQSSVQEEWRALSENYPVNPLTGDPWTTDELNAIDRGGRTDS